MVEFALNALFVAWLIGTACVWAVTPWFLVDNEPLEAGIAGLIALLSTAGLMTVVGP